MIRAPRLLALSALSVALMGLVGPTAGCSKFGDSTEAPVDAGPAADVAPGDGGKATGPRRIYVYGGVTYSPGALSVGAQYATVGSDGELSSWTRVNTLDDDRFAGAWVQSGANVFGFGGIVVAKPDSNQSGVRGMLAEEPPTGAGFWTKLAAMPTGRKYAAAVMRGKSVYVSGGRTDSAAIGNVERWDSDDTWAPAGAMKTALAGHAALLRNDQMYVLGGDRRSLDGLTAAVTKAGFDANGVLQDFQVAGALSLVVAYHSIALVGPWLFVIGGKSNPGTIPGVMRGTFDETTGEVATMQIGTLPAPAKQTGLTSACTVVVDHTIYVMGGVDVEGKPSMGEVYIGRVDVATGAVDWKTSASALPVGRAAFGCAVSP